MLRFAKTAPAALVAATTDRPPELCAFVYADRLAVFSGAEAARTWLARTPRTPRSAVDPLGDPLAADLAARGILDPRVRLE